MSVACATSVIKGYQIKRLSEALTVPCPCGSSTRPFTRNDTTVCNLHVTQITDSKRHYHKHCTEVYFIGVFGVPALEEDDEHFDC